MDGSGKGWLPPSLPLPHLCYNHGPGSTMDNSTLWPGESFTSDLLVAVKMFVVGAESLMSDTASSAQERRCRGQWPCCRTQNSLKTPAHGANLPAPPPSPVSPITGGGGRPPCTALPAKAFHWFRVCVVQRGLRCSSLSASFIAGPQVAQPGALRAWSCPRPGTLASRCRHPEPRGLWSLAPTYVASRHLQYKTA